jgi:hypothetical protein
MLDKSAPWVAKAWQHWHRPWAVTHPSWISPSHAGLIDNPAHEPLLRLHYPAWCRTYALDGPLTEFRDSLWWRVFGLPRDAFDRASDLVGWTLGYAADPRRRLQWGSTLEIGLARWALGRAHFMPAPVAEWVSAVTLRGHATAGEAAGYLAGATLSRCVPDEEPVLWPRMRMRSPRPLGLDDDMPIGLHVHAHLVSLWSAAARHVMPQGGAVAALAAAAEASA